MSESSHPITPIAEFELVVEQTGLIKVPDKQKAELVAVLKPIAEQIQQGVEYANALVITNDAQAKVAAATRDTIVAQSAIAETALTEFDDKLISRLYNLHRGWTGLLGRFTKPMTESAKTIKRKIGDYEFAKEQAAEKERQRLQAEADAKARAEQERLQKKADSMKTPEKQEQYREQAAAVVAPVIQVPVAKTGTKFQERWAVDEIDLHVFLKAASGDSQLMGYVTVDNTKLIRSKAANTMIEIPGVKFKKVRV